MHGFNSASDAGNRGKNCNPKRRIDTRTALPIITSPRSENFVAAADLNPKISMPSTQVILTENVPGLGAEADVVTVRRGFARNFLLPKGKAYEVTPQALRQLDALKAKRAEREARELNEAEELARRIGKLKVTFGLQTGETGKAFGSITANDLAERLKQELNRDFDRHLIVLEHPIKTTGEHEVSLKLHHEVTARFKFNVKSAEEPKPEIPATEETTDKRHRGPRKRTK
jgi:large subunit ribosomal protein L9